MSPPFIDHVLDRLFDPEPVVRPRRVLPFEPAAPLEAEATSLEPFPARVAPPSAPTPALRPADESPIVEPAQPRPPAAAAPAAVPVPATPLGPSLAPRTPFPPVPLSAPVETPPPPAIRPRLTVLNPPSERDSRPGPPGRAPISPPQVTQVIERTVAAPPGDDVRGRLIALERAVAALPVPPPRSARATVAVATPASVSVPRPRPPDMAPPSPPRSAIQRRREPGPALVPEPEPSVRVTIGRIDVRAVAAPEGQRARTARPPRMSLDDYLRQRERG